MFEEVLTARPVGVRRATVGSDGVVLRLATGEQVTLAVLPDRRCAWRSCGLAQRVLSVALDARSDPWSAEVTAVWHRVPRTVPLRLPAALALVAQGIPATVRGLTRP